MNEPRRRVTFVTEVGSPTVEEGVAVRLRDALRARPGATRGRELAAADVIDAALLSDRRVKFAYAEQLSTIGVLQGWEPLDDTEIIALAAALRQIPSLTHEIGYERHPDEILGRMPRLDADGETA